MKNHIINENILDDELRLVRDDGSFDIVKTDDALTEAYNQDLDLVIVSTNSNPKVAKIMNYSKFLYEQKKNKKESKQPNNTIKELQIRPSIQENDLKIKHSQVEKFLSSGHNVRIVVKLRGRERSLYTPKTVIETFMSKIDNFKIVSGNVASGSIIIGRENG